MNKYDYIFVGTGIIPVLEAVYLSRSGKSVLMIDNQKEMGGAWISLNIFGLEKVENAIHYFMPDPYAFDFMKEVLGWDVIESERKFRVFPMPFSGYWKLPYDNNIGRLLGRVISAYCSSENTLERLLRMVRAVKEWGLEYKQKSYYVRGGTEEIINKVRALLLSSNVEVKYSTQIEKFFIDKEKQYVKVHTEKQEYISSSVYFTHGSRIPELVSTSGTYTIVEKEHLRPAVHMLIDDNTPSHIYECIFTADPVIKYIHDVTKYTHNAANLIGKKKIFVFALHPHVNESDKVYQAIFDKIKKIGLIGQNSTMENKCWWNVYLPRLYDEDLQRLKEEFGPQVEILETENTSRGISVNIERWKSTFSHLGENNIKFKN